MITTPQSPVVEIRGKRQRGPIRSAVIWGLYGLIAVGVVIIAILILGTISWMSSRSQSQQMQTTRPQSSHGQTQADVQLYLDGVVQVLGRGTASQMQVINQLDLIVGKPMMALAPEWRNPTSSAVSNLRRAGQELQNRQLVPSKAQELNRQMVLVGGDMVSNADAYTAFMNGEGSQHLDIAARRMATMNSRIEQTLPLIKALHEGR